MSGAEYDVFISYAHRDDRGAGVRDRWVCKFHELLKSYLEPHFPGGFRIWRDTRLEGSQLFDKAISDRINRSKIFLVLLSPFYLESDYCEKELEWFVDHAGKSGPGLTVGEHKRVVHVMLYPIDRSEWPDALQGASGVTFHESASSTDHQAGVYPLKPDGDEFETAIRQLVAALCGAIGAYDLYVDGERTVPEKRQSSAANVAQSFQKLAEFGSALEAPEVQSRLTDTHGRLSELRAKMSTSMDQVDTLSARKDLHDQLHELEFKVRQPIAALPRTSSDGQLDDESVESLEEHGYEFDEILAALDRIQARGILPESDTGWIARLVDARRQLEQTCSEASPSRLRRTLKAIDRVLVREPSRINTLLANDARRLRLAALALELGEVASVLEDAGLDAASTEQLRQGVHALGEIDANLAAMVAQHDQWQLIAEELRLLEATMEGGDGAASFEETEEISETWEFVRRSALDLYGDCDEPWAERLRYFGKKLEDALEAGNPAGVRKYFLRYNRYAKDRFYRADLDLKQGYDGAYGADFAALTGGRPYAALTLVPAEYADVA